MDKQVVIQLDFDKMLSFISGRDYGKEVFINQVKPKIKDLNSLESLQIIYPEQVINVSISFTKGLITDLVNSLGLERTLKIIDFKTNKLKLDNKIKEDLYF